MIAGTVKIYKCNQCGKEGRWTSRWRHKEEIRGRGIMGYEVTIHVCSDRCAEDYDLRTKRRTRKKQSKSSRAPDCANTGGDNR